MPTKIRLLTIRVLLIVYNVLRVIIPIQRNTIIPVLAGATLVVQTAVDYQEKAFDKLRDVLKSLIGPPPMPPAGTS